MRIVNDAFIAALETNALLEFFLGLAGDDHLFGKLAAFFEGLGAFAEKKHPCGKFDAQFAEFRSAAAAENIDALGDFVGVAGHAAKWLVHIGNERDDFFAHALAGFDHDFSEANGIFFAFHEGTRAGFDVEDESVDAFRKFLAHDRSADETDIFDRGSNIAERVDFFVGRGDFRGLADEAHAAFAQNTDEFFERKIYVEAGDGFEFIECATSVAQAAAANHGHRKAASGDDWSEDERSFIPNASGGMLVDFFRWNTVQIDDFPGIKHSFSERGRLGAIKAANPRGHKPSGHLIVGNIAARVAGNQEVDLLAGVFTGIAFFADEVDGAHA